eukprot:5611178-Pyramimonas_sp.AAC.1
MRLAQNLRSIARFGDSEILYEETGRCLLACRTRGWRAPRAGSHEDASRPALASAGRVLAPSR